MKLITRVVIAAGIIVAALAGLLPPLQGAEKSVKPAPVRIAYVSRSILDMPYMIARDR